MRLKRLILHGFKSFADRTEFVFDCPITGIVGPNGCGKSNVVDGFKWVLGEQSAKSLRGDAMLDVIFNGSGGRKPAGMSEVVLVFDNPRNIDGTRKLTIDVEEVSVGRRLFRDGTSEYQLNNQATRLRDIRELFLDTGVGVDAYSVIEQGKVDLLLQSNPQERRLIFEEAAGISKYKAKKKEAQRKLERVDQNLLRVKDIVDEVDKRLRSVRIQAGRARTYQEQTQRLRELRLKYALQEYHTLFQQRQELSIQQESAEKRVAELGGQLAEMQAQLMEQRSQYEDLVRNKQRAEYERVQAQASIQSARQKQQYATQQLQQIAEQLAQCQIDRDNAQVRGDEVAEALAQETRQLTQLSEELSQRTSAIEQLRATFHDGQLRATDVGRSIEQNKTAVLDLMRQSAAVGNRLGAIEIERKNIAAQQQRLGERRRSVAEELAGLQSARAELDSAMADLLSGMGRLQSALEQGTADLAALGRQIAQLSEQLGAAREHRSGLLSRQKLLADLEARREGVSEGAKEILQQKDRYPFIRGLVADILRVDVEHAPVIEAALDGRDQFLVSDSREMAMSAGPLYAELEGRAGIVCRDSLERFDDRYDWNQHPQLIRRAVDLVRFEPHDAPLAEHLLGRTVVTDDLTDAAELAKTGPSGYRYVTLGGQVAEADGTLRVGPIGGVTGLLTRRSELETLELQIADVEQRIALLADELRADGEQSRALQEKQNALRHSIHEANTKKVELSSRISQNQDKQSSFDRELPLLDRELVNLQTQTTRLAAEEEQLSQKRSQLEADQTSRQQEIEQLTARQAELNEMLRHAGEQLTTARVELGQVQEKQLASQQAERRLQGSAAELKAQIERLSRSAEQLTDRQQTVENELAAAQESEASLVESTAQLEAQVTDLAERVAALQEQVEALGASAGAVQAEHAKIEQSLHQLQLSTGELRVRLEGLVQRTLEELQLDLPARYAELEQSGGYQPTDTDWDAVAQEIKELRDRIQRLGNVNLDAINEQDDLEKRQQFLATQLNDLIESKKQLEELIDTINKESSARFEQTFNAVREHFQGMFRKLFGGGKADIYLETELQEAPAKGEAAVGPDGQPLAAQVRRVDALDAGIEIIARPPGKQPVSISQLSGGEKTMTCVALLMSIFKSKPSPFCILDEVDAALDEANNARFNLIVQEFLDQSQFIIITHSKRTMQIADMLYGVTMQEQGVSKRVAVRFDQVDNQGRISEHAAA